MASPSEPYNWEKLMSEHGSNDDGNTPLKAHLASTNYDHSTKHDFDTMTKQYEKHAEAIQATYDKFPNLTTVSHIDSEVTRNIFDLPVIRPLEAGEGVQIRWSGMKRVHLAYMRGILQEVPCDQCGTCFERIGKGPPYAKCVILKGFFNDACVSCTYRNSKGQLQTPCSFLQNKPNPPKLVNDSEDGLGGCVYPVENAEEVDRPNASNSMNNAENDWGGVGHSIENAEEDST